MRSLLNIVGVLLLTATLAWAQTHSDHDRKRGTRETCLKNLPSDWDVNFDHSWRQNEARYWACRLGVPVERVQAWQRNAGLNGAIQDVIAANFNGEEVVLIQELQGSANCFVFQALRRVKGNWIKSWSIPFSESSDPMHYCTISCPPIRMSVHGKSLELELPHPANHNEDISRTCRGVSWSREIYTWNGTTFEENQKDTTSIVGTR